MNELRAGTNARVEVLVLELERETERVGVEMNRLASRFVVRSCAITPEIA
jgi:hypothetical protein